MSILIKGMEMPQNCTECRFAVDGWCYAYGRPNIEALANYERTNFCPLVPVPDHGRLIDADALDHQIYNDIPLKVFGNIARMTEMRNIVYHAPTIIEAEGEDGT